MWDWAGTVQAPACKLSDAKSNLPCAVGALVKVTNFNSHRGIMMPAGLLEPVSILVSVLLTCLGDKQW